MELNYDDKAWDGVSDSAIAEWDNGFNGELEIGCEVIVKARTNNNKDKNTSRYIKGIILRTSDKSINVLIKNQFTFDFRMNSILCVSKTAEDCIRAGITKIK